MISVDRFDIITPQGIGKRIKEEKILYWFGVYCMRVYQPGNRVSNSSLKRNIYRCFLITAARGNGDNAKQRVLERIARFLLACLSDLFTNKSIRHLGLLFTCKLAKMLASNRWFLLGDRTTFESWFCSRGLISRHLLSLGTLAFSLMEVS